MSKPPARKSILANFSSFEPPPVKVNEGQIGGDPAASVLPAQQLPRVGAGVIGATQRSLSDLREERDRLRAQVDAGGSAEIDPALIDPSPFPDRLPDDADVSFVSLKKLISEEGQKVPIQVRPHPTDEGRYQVVYGHRRWRAASELGIKVKATILPLTDSELVVAQGIENAARQDLSWIERALFAWRMENANIKARDIRAALSIDDAELAKFRAVCRALPVDVIEAIGRAPKVGRPRWLALATAVGGSGIALSQVVETLSADKVLALPSDDRFRQALNAIKQPDRRTSSELALKGPNGKAVGKATFKGGDVKLSIGEEHASAFSQFMENELPDLLSRFFAEKDE